MLHRNSEISHRSNLRSPRRDNLLDHRSRSTTAAVAAAIIRFTIKKKKKNSPPKNRRPEQPSIAGNEHKSGSMLISGGVYDSFPFLSFPFEGERSVGTKNRRNPRGRSACFGSSRGRSLSSEHPSGPLTIISAVRVRQQPLTHWSMPTHAASLSPFLVPLTPRERPHSFRERSPVSVRPTTLRSPLPLALTLCLFSSLALFLLRSSLSLYLPPNP